MKKQTLSKTEEPTTSNTFKAPFDATAEARAKLSTAELMTINVDARLVLTTVLGALPKLQAVRADLVRLFDFDIEQFDALGTYAAALGYAHSAYLGAVETTDPLPELATRASALRDQLANDAATLGRRNLLDAKRLAELKGGNGYLNIGSDLGLLLNVLREAWAAIANKSAIEESELEEAERLYHAMNAAYGSRAQATRKQTTATEDRQRAYTLVVRAYNRARHAVIYLRGERGDADEIAPSLWKGRGARWGSKEEPEDKPVVVEGEDPTVPVEAPVTPVQPTGSGVPDAAPIP